MKKRERWIPGVYCAAIFVFVLVFFTAIHPMIVLSPDDWTYISYSRHAYPLWGDWNPTRVFPEVFMPLCGSIAAYGIYPLTGNYLGSFTIVSAVAMGFFIAGYVYLFAKVLNKKFGLPVYQALLWASLFLLLHFLAFRSREAGNESLLQPHNVTQCYYYFIPSLLNGGLVLYLMLDDMLDDGWKKLKTGVYMRHPVRYGFLVLLLYMALNSNLFCSAVLAVYIGLQLLGELIDLFKKKVSFGACIQKNFLRLLYIFFWGIVQIFENNGGRAQEKYLYDEKLSSSLPEGIRDTLRSYVKMGCSLNKTFVLLSMLIVVVALLLFLAKRTRGRIRPSVPMSRRTFFVIPQMTGGGLLLGAYLLLLCAATGAEYIERTGVLLGLAFYFFFAIILCGVYISKRVPLATLLLPLLLCVLFFEVNTQSRTFVEATSTGIDPVTCVAVEEDVIQQFIDAEKSGADEVTIYVPRFNNSSNKPFQEYAASRIATTLYKHGVIRKEIRAVATVPCDEKNEKFGIPLPE